MVHRIAIADALPNRGPPTSQPEGAERFYGLVRKYYPGLRDGTLAPDYAGMRAKITPPGAPAADFVVQVPAAPSMFRGVI